MPMRRSSAAVVSRRVICVTANTAAAGYSGFADMWRAKRPHIRTIRGFRRRFHE